MVKEAQVKTPEDTVIADVTERLEAETDLRARTCKQIRLGHDVEYKSPVDVMTMSELIATIEADALLAIVRDHVNIMLRRRIPKTANADDIRQALGSPQKVVDALRAYRYNARSGEVSQATKDKNLGKATRKLMEQFGVDNELELVEILKERMAQANK